MNIQRRVTNRILDMLQRYEVPWRFPYHLDPNSGLPMNVRSRKLYRGVNPILLGSASQRFGYTSKWWGTEEDWKLDGATVTDDSRGVTVAVYHSDGYGEEIVFNLDDVRGCDRLRPLCTEEYADKILALHFNASSFAWRSNSSSSPKSPAT